MLAQFHKLSTGYHRFIAGWVVAVARRAWLVVAGAIIVSVLLLGLIADQIEVNTDTEDMLSADLPFRQDSIALSDAFPQFSDNILIVLDGTNPDLVADGAARMVEALGARRALFGEVFYPPNLPYFRRNGLMFLGIDELSELVDRLSTAQPFLGTLWRNPSLSALFDLIHLALTEEGASDTTATARAVNAIAEVVEAQSAGEKKYLAWQTLMTGEAPEPDDLRRFILVQPKLDFGSLQPGSDAIEALRAIADELRLGEDFGLRMRLTGSVPLAQEELESVVDGLGLAGLLSLTLVLVLLAWGLRSVQLVIATLITLIAGLIWTAAFAIVAIGALNLISVAFAVLFIGLSVDFGIHYALRYRELCTAGEPPMTALGEAARSVGGAITMTAVAAAIGFYAFLPTDYRGLAELGLIAGSGMFIALFANLTLLPALLALMPLSSTTRPPRHTRQWRAITDRPRTVVLGALVIGLGAAMLLPQARFDFDPLSLKDRKTESVATIFDLMTDPQANPYVISVLAEDLATATNLAAQLDQSNLVDGTALVTSFIPKNQTEKLEIIEGASLILSSVFTARGELIKQPSEATAKAIRKFQTQLQKVRTANAVESTLRKATERLATALDNFSRTPGLSAATGKALEGRLLATLPGRLTSLRDALLADRVGPDDIPAVIRAREVSTDGRARLQVFPKEDLRDRDALVRFVEDVRRIAPRATGAPVIILEAGDTVVTAFIEAGVISGVLITAMLALLLGNLRGLVLVYAPLTLATVLTVAASVLLDLPFNFANVIVLPLLFGLGVASAIHLIVRSQSETGDKNVLETSTPRAVVFSALTTIGSFGSIALSSHPGTSSMGVLLTIALALTLFATLIVLPALMQIWPPRRDREVSA